MVGSFPQGSVQAGGKQMETKDQKTLLWSDTTLCSEGRIAVDAPDEMRH